MPAAIPIAMAVGGAALSAGGAATNKPKQTSTLRNLEPEYFSNFRKSLTGPYGSMLAKAGQPMYGQAEQAGFTNALNKASMGAERNLASRLAGRTGSVNSGAYGAGLNDIFMNRIGKQAEYATQIPMLNREAYFKNMGGVLGMGMNWAGRAPVDQDRTETQSNGSFLSNFMGGLGATMSGGAGLGGGFQGLGGLFNRGSNIGPSNPNWGGWS